MEQKIEEIRKDITELETLQTQVTRQKIKDILSIELRKLVSEHVKLVELLKNQDSQTLPVAASISSVPKRYQIKVNNYAWDQSAKFVKFFVTLSKVHTIASENIECKFTSKSLELQVKDLESKDYIFTINNLMLPINPETSSWKAKTDMIVISVAKIENTTWSHVTELEKKASDAKKFTPEKTEEKGSEDSIISLMKNMYEKGDDDLKRTIAKAWTESQRNGPGPAGF